MRFDDRHLRPVRESHHLSDDTGGSGASDSTLLRSKGLEPHSRRDRANDSAINGAAIAGTLEAISHSVDYARHVELLVDAAMPRLVNGNRIY